MITQEKLQLNRIYDSIAESLNISDNMAEKAIKSYEAVGKWLGDCDPQYNIKIMPQGSFYLGTVIKPISDKDDYDIDLVCLLNNAESLSEKDIKHTVGNRLKQNDRYKLMLDAEGKRCWTLNYDEFHMDILPCIPNHKMFLEPYFTEIKLTHKEPSGLYTPKYSNPYKYHAWFEEQMTVSLTEAKEIFAARNKVDITKVTTSKVHTPLQKAVQLLKRHRDIMFQKNDDDAPISIIITTLAGHAYSNQVTTYEALELIINNMSKYIEQKSDDTYWVANPALTSENFADKWKEAPAKKEAFFNWLKKAKVDILDNPLSVTGLDEVSRSIKESFGKNIVDNSLKSIANQDRTLRENGGMYVNGLTGGLTTIKSETVKKVGGHTFFGS